MADPQLVDPGNELLWRMRLRQMESESVRDAILLASGRLEDTLGGPPTMIEGKPDGTVVVKKEGTPPGSANRRSMYLLARRRYNLSLLEAFDQPELTSNCTRRTPSAVVSQSLTMLNDDFVKEQAAEFAALVRRDASERKDQIARAFRVALAREPAETEAAWATDLLDRQTQRYQQAADAAGGSRRQGTGALVPDAAEHERILVYPLEAEPWEIRRTIPPRE